MTSHRRCLGAGETLMLDKCRADVALTLLKSSVAAARPLAVRRRSKVASVESLSLVVCGRLVTRSVAGGSAAAPRRAAPRAALVALSLVLAAPHWPGVAHVSLYIPLSRPASARPDTSEPRFVIGFCDVTLCVRYIWKWKHSKHEKKRIFNLMKWLPGLSTVP